MIDWTLYAQLASSASDVQVAFLPALIGAGAALIGGVLNRRSAERQQQQSYAQTDAQRAQDRRFYLRDREHEEKYNKRLTQDDRTYAQRQRDNERQYAKTVTVDQRVYDNKIKQDQRRYDEKRLTDDRAYANKRLSEQRVYDQRMYDMDLRRHDKDRDFMQDRSNDLAEKSAASRGIDFSRLRDDAMAAGYNPMTALSMAHAYSTHVDYGVQGGVYSPRANYTTGNQAYSPMGSPGSGSGGGGGGTVAPAGAVMPSHVPAGGGFQASGGGYQSQFNPALSAGSFIQEAMERGLDAWSNRPVERDPLADALRNAFQQDQMAQEVRDSQIPGDFGYSLTKQKAFQPSATVGVPALASANKAVMPSGVMEVGGRKFIPVTKPNGKPGRVEASIASRLDLKPFDTVSPGDWAEIVGEVGEAESLIDQPAIRRTILDEWKVGPQIPAKVKDYLKSGRTGAPQFPRGQHYNPWMQ